MPIEMQVDPMETAYGRTCVPIGQHDALSGRQHDGAGAVADGKQSAAARASYKADS